MILWDDLASFLYLNLFNLSRKSLQKMQVKAKVSLLLPAACWLYALVWHTLLMVTDLLMEGCAVYKNLTIHSECGRFGSDIPKAEQTIIDHILTFNLFTPVHEMKQVMVALMTRDSTCRHCWDHQACHSCSHSHKVLPTSSPSATWQVLSTTALTSC